MTFTPATGLDGGPRWEDPPAAARRSRGSKYIDDATVAELVANPGRSLLLGTFDKASTAQSAKKSLKTHLADQAGFRWKLTAATADGSTGLYITLEPAEAVTAP